MLQRIGLTVIMLLLAVSVSAQMVGQPFQPQPGPAYSMPGPYPVFQPSRNSAPLVYASIEPAWTHYKAKFHEDQYSPGFQTWTAQLSAQALFPGIGLLRYTFTPGANHEETVTLTGHLKVADVEWKAQQGQSQQNKPLAMGLSVGATNRVTADIFTPFPVRITGLIEQANASIGAKGEANGKQVDVWEDADKTFWGAGLAWDYRPTLLRVTLGPNYQLLEASIYEPVSSWATVGVSYRFRKLDFSGPLTVREDSVGAWMEARF